MRAKEEGRRKEERTSFINQVVAALEGRNTLGRQGAKELALDTGAADRALSKLQFDFPVRPGGGSDLTQSAG
jgi:hypothetical protein